MRGTPAPNAAGQSATSQFSEPGRHRPLIVLANNWHDDNKGDSAITQATIELLRLRLPGARFVVASVIDEHDPSFATAHRHLARQFPDLEFQGSSQPILRRASAAAIATTAARLTSQALGLMSSKAQETALGQVIARADLVIAKGGQYLCTHRRWHPLNLTHVFRHVYPLVIAAKCSVPYAIFGHSIGPIQDPLSRMIVGGVLRNAAAVATREESSARLATELGVRSERLRVVPDTAFAIEPEYSARVEQVLGRHGLRHGRFLTVTVRECVDTNALERKSSTERYLQEVARLVKRLLESAFCEGAVIVAHTAGPTDREDDRIASRRLAALTADERVFYVDDDLSPAELAALYGASRLLIGTRLHSVILAAAAGTPAYAVSYFGPKTAGVMGLLGLQRLTAGIQSFDAELAWRAIASTDLERLRSSLAAWVESARLVLRGAAGCLGRLTMDRDEGEVWRDLPALPRGVGDE